MSEECCFLTLGICENSSDFKRIFSYEFSLRNKVNYFSKHNNKLHKKSLVTFVFLYGAVVKQEKNTVC